jgi:hypothetical protein
MTEAAAQVDVVRAQLSEAESVAAGLRAEAQRAADALVINPNRATQVERDELAGRLELAQLQIAALQRSLAEAEGRAREDAIGQLLSGASEVQTRASEADDALWRSLGEHEAVLAAVLGCRQELRRLNGRLGQLGYTGHALQVANRPRQGEYGRRIERLQGQYSKASHPLMMPPVVGAE